MTTPSDRAAAPSALVAEDDRILADVVRFTLVRAGFQVTVAHDGRRALAQAKARSFDLIVSDYQMPHLNGEEFLRGVRRDSLCRESRLILCSAKGYEMDNARWQAELGLETVLIKPFSPRELIEAAQGTPAT